MQYYIQTKKELNYILSAPFDTRESAEAELEKADDKTKKKSVIYEIPTIKDGLNLYRNGSYWKTIIGEITCLWLLGDINDLDDISTPVEKETLVRWFIKMNLDIREDYNNGIEFKDLDYVGYDSDDKINVGDDNKESED